MAAADDAAADGRPHAGAAGRRHAERVQQVARRVRIRRAHGQHGAGQHDRPVDVRQHMAQQRGGIGERIRAVREDEAVPVRAARPDRPRHGHAVGGGQVGRVQLHQLAHAGLAHLRQIGQLREQRGPVQHGREPLRGLAAGDRPAGRNQ